MTLLRHGTGEKKLKGTQPKGPLVLLCHDFFTDSDYMIKFLATDRTSYYWCFKLGRSNPVIPTTAPIKRTLHFESGEMSRPSRMKPVKRVEARTECSVPQKHVRDRLSLPLRACSLEGGQLYREAASLGGALAEKVFSGHMKSEKQRRAPVTTGVTS
ncbi:Choline Transporter-Like Protein 4 [Manis pentadactyla]|nr:Choline Transporter-Like Protein 4 [Manis pentadactyla]